MKTLKQSDMFLLNISFNGSAVFLLNTQFYGQSSLVEFCDLSRKQKDLRLEIN